MGGHAARYALLYFDSMGSTKLLVMRSLSIVAVSLAGSVFGQVYNESAGLVVMEAQNTGSSPGLWEERSSLAGYSGSGYLQFFGNTFETGPAGFSSGV